MYGLREMLLQEQKHLQSIIANVSESKIATPEGRLRISVDHGVTRCYHCIDDRYGEYIPRENMQLPHQLAQKAYNEAVLKTAEARAKHIARCLKNYNDDELEQLFTSLHPERQRLITPVEPTFSQLQERWYSESYVGKAFKEGMPVILTEKGERVRSKSEKILADFNMTLLKCKKAPWNNNTELTDERR